MEQGDPRKPVLEEEAGPATAADTTTEATAATATTVTAAVPSYAPPPPRPGSRPRVESKDPLGHFTPISPTKRRPTPRAFPSRQRLCIVNRNVPGALGDITSQLGLLGVNILRHVNRPVDDEIAYNVIDVDTSQPPPPPPSHSTPAGRGEQASGAGGAGGAGGAPFTPFDGAYVCAEMALLDSVVTCDMQVRRQRGGRGKGGRGGRGKRAREHGRGKR